jgi:N-terminal domain on NACHT_NTPase and P-loop NTPases
MSFGYSVSDIVVLGQLAWKAYRSCKDAPESFRNISREVLSLHALLKEIEENIGTETLSSSQAHLKTIGDGCRNVLEELQSLVDKYESLGTQSKRSWDRMKWGCTDIAELRSRLTSNTLLLSAFIRCGHTFLSTKCRVTSMH